ncbi:DNA internalization-related competence protein ComEC/Rec2 [Halomonas sp. WWR20]
MSSWNSIVCQGRVGGPGWESKQMRMGWACPMAIAAIAGSVLGRWAGFDWHEVEVGLAAAAQVWALALCLSLAWRRPRVATALVVFAVCAAQVLAERSAVLPLGLSRQDVALQGRLLEVDVQDALVRLRLSVESCSPLEALLPACSRLGQVRLSWYDGPALQVGERWALTARLRPPTGFANAHTFDYQAWLWREGVHATGYVRASPAPRRLTPAPSTWRHSALAYLDAKDLPPLAGRWLAALTLGASERLTRDDWDLFNATGTTHLMVISGLHIGLVAALMLWLSRRMARLLAPGSWRLATWPWWLAGMSAAAYAWLAGLDPPAMRAMLMTLVGLWVASGRHAPGAWQAWWLALGCVVVVDPLAPWRPGFWLSFMAVAVLILAWDGRERPKGPKGWLWALCRTQLLLAPLMAAAVLLAFGRLAPVAPLVNLMVVPLVSSVMVPLGLLGWGLAWLAPLSMACWWLFAWLAAFVHGVLVWSAALLPAWSPDAWQLMPLTLGLGSLGLLWSLPGLTNGLRIWGSVSLTLLLWVVEPPVPNAGSVEMIVHDVGQGQLIELRSAHYRLLFDTGPRFGSGFMVLDSLWASPQDFDDVIVSHGDQDHAGGIGALVEHHHVGQWWAPRREALEVKFTPCEAGVHWRRDGIEYRFLSPQAGDTALSSNDGSCVLLVDAGNERALITGDAGTAIEARLVKQLSGPLSVLVAGHHGSRTSSSVSFVKAMAPVNVVFSAGRDNRYGHPHAEVVRRFRAAHACLWDTAYDGALRFTLGQSNSAPKARRPPSGVEGRCVGVESRG